MSYLKNNSTVIELMKEKQICNFLKAQEGGKRPMNFIGDFTCKKNNEGKWEVGFVKISKDNPSYDYSNTMNCKVAAKTGSIRGFLRLNGVEKFMKKIGAEDFTVIMEN